MQHDKGYYLWRQRATAWQKQQYEFCLGKRHRLACASSSLTNNAPSRSHWVHSEYWYNCGCSIFPGATDSHFCWFCHALVQISFHTLWYACGVTVWKHMVVWAFMVNTIFLWADTFNFLVSSADNLYKQFGPRSGPTKTSGLILIQLVEVFLNNLIYKKKIRRSKNHD